MKFSRILPISFLVLAACAADAQKNYTVTMDANPADNNTMAYLINWDTQAKLDSAVVTDNKINFAGTVADDFIGRVIVNGKRGPMFIVEQGDIVIDPNGDATGTPLNEKWNAYATEISKIQDEFNKLNPADSVDVAKAKELEEAYNAVPAKAFKENADNALGLYWFMQMAYDLTLPQLQEEIAKNPALAKSGQVEGLLNAKKAKEATSVGNHYKDFTITYDGKEYKLSDYVKPGKYTLVDFWASWCGPCIRQTKVIKELYEKYKDKGLDVVGVAVWDEPENTLKAIKTHDLQWPCIINAQTIPTDLYGISGIPCIILINPDGVIISRDKQGQELKDDVDSAMAAYEQPASAEAPASNQADTAAIF